MKAGTLPCNQEDYLKGYHLNVETPALYAIPHMAASQDPGVWAEELQVNEEIVLHGILINSRFLSEALEQPAKCSINTFNKLTGDMDAVGHSLYFLVASPRI